MRRAPAVPSAEDAVNTPVLQVFVPNGDSREDTAILLVGTADEYGLSQRHVRADRARGGFWISDALADIVYDDSTEDDNPETPDSPETGSTTK